MDITGPGREAIAPIYELSATMMLIATLTCSLLALAALAYALRVAQLERMAYPVWMFVGAAISTFNEPFVDVLGHVVFPRPDTAAISTFGREMPIYLALAYCFYFLVPPLWLLGRLRAGMTQRTWWTYFAVATLISATLWETIPIHLGWWMYYGSNQPFKIFGLPLWWGFVNTFILFTIAAFCHLLIKHVLGRRLVALLAVVVPVAVWSLYAAAGFPIFTALNTSDSAGAAKLGTVITIALTLVLTGIIGRAATSRSLEHPALEASSEGRMPTGNAA